MPLVNVWTIPRRRDRAWLHFEEIARPMGIGGAAPALVFLESVRSHPFGFWHWFPFTWAAFWCLLLVIGLWRPLHRRIGIRPYDLWGK